MLSSLTGPEMFPYAVAAGVLFGLVVIEAVGMLAGAGPLSSLGHFLGAHGHGGPGGTPDASAGSNASHVFPVLGWLNASRAPFAAVLMSLLAGFALAGIATVTLCSSVGIPCAPVFSIPVAVIASSVLTRSVMGIVGRLMPQDETYAIGPEALIGSLAVVTVGPVRKGHRGRGKTRDRHGNSHFPILEVVDPAASFGSGETVMLVAHRSGTFLVAAPDERLLPRKHAKHLET